MCNIVTKRFNETVGLLREQNLVKSARQLALSLDYIPQSMGAILNGERDVTIDLLRKATENYPINIQYIFTGQGSPLMSSEESKPKEADVADNIYYIPVAAQAGYTEQYYDEYYLKDLSTFSLPQFKHQKGEFRCFEIQGDSMEPTLFSSDKIIGSLVRRENNYTGIRNNYVYVIVTRHGLLVKRVVNKIQANGTLELISDNIFYEPYSVKIEDVLEVWSIHVKISSFNGSPSHFQNGFQEKMKNMSITIDTQSEAIKNLNKTLEQLLKQHRSTNVMR
ncbi:MAG: S24 family peptidase [Saprospiraceae bacterium]